jgi:hypothetical protein
VLLDAMCCHFAVQGHFAVRCCLAVCCCFAVCCCRCVTVCCGMGVFVGMGATVGLCGGVWVLDLVGSGYFPTIFCSPTPVAALSGLCPSVLLLGPWPRRPLWEL